MNAFKKTALMASVSAIALVAAGNAMADDYVDTSKFVAHTSWNGFYIGTHAGVGEGNWEDGFEVNSLTDSRVELDRADTSGLFAGGQIGYLWDRGRYVVGIEADISVMGDWFDEVQAASSSEEAELEIDLLASVRGRIGVPVGAARQGLLYGTAGIAFVDASVLACSDACNSSTVVTQEIDFNDIGFVAGTGFEWALTDRFRIRGESLYYFFDESNPITIPGVDAGDQATLDDAWVLRLGGSWFFNTQ